MWLKVYKTKFFNKWAIDHKVTENSLTKVADEIENGLIDVYLGGFLYKKRIHLASKGKRGGARVILAYREEDKIIFLYGFAKNERDNITRKERSVLKKLADFYFDLSEQDINKALIVKELMEVKSCVQRS